MPIHPASQEVTDARNKLSRALIERNKAIYAEYKKLKRGQTWNQLAAMFGMNRTAVIMVVRKMERWYQPE